jgi:hypothetical protein
MRDNIGTGIFDTISISPESAVMLFYSVVAKPVLCLSTTWLRVALLHSPASVSTALPGFFMRGRMAGMINWFRYLSIHNSPGI